MESLPAPLRAARRLRTALLVLLLADAGAAWVVIAGVVTLLQRFWLGSADRVLPTSIETHVGQLEAARRVQGLLIVATAAVFLGWLARVSRHLHRFGVPRLRFSTGAAVAAFVVPLVNVLAPVRVVRELWLASRPDAHDSPWWEARGPLLIPVWWALVVASQVADPVWRPLAGSMESLAVGGSTLLFIVAQLAAIAAAILGVAIVWTIDAQLMRQLAALEP
jgi:hypothetical protein